jgi:WD40 repeat protein
VALFDSDKEPVPAGALAFDTTGRWVAAGSHWHGGATPMLRIADLETGEVRAFPLEGDDDGSLLNRGIVWFLSFAPDGTLYSAGDDGVRHWDTTTGASEWLVRDTKGSFVDLSADGRYLMLGWGTESGFELQLQDLSENTEREIDSHGSSFSAIDLGPDGESIVTGDAEGVVRVGPANGEEPHLLLGHEGAVEVVATSPDGRWIASGAGDEIRLWPMPDLSKPPLHTLPREELIAKLKTLTNLRVVRDEEAPSGWKLTHDPFPGWETVPSW